MSTAKGLHQLREAIPKATAGLSDLRAGQEGDSSQKWDGPGLRSHSDFSVGFVVSVSVSDIWLLHSPSQTPGPGLLNVLSLGFTCKQR